MPPPEKSEPYHLTLRFKNSNQTTLLMVDSFHTFETIAEDLLAALREAYPDQRLPSGTSIPSSAEDVILGTPNDINDLENGGYKLLWSADAVEQAESAAEKKKRFKKGEDDTPSGVGIKNGAVIAYKFRKQEDDGGMDLDDTWDVKVPKYDDDE